MVKRHTKPTQHNPQGGIVEKEGSVEVSNVALWCGKCVGPARARRSTTKDGQQEAPRLREVRHGVRDRVKDIEKWLKTNEDEKKATRQGRQARS